MAVYCAVNAVCCSVSLTLASMTHPSPPECIFCVLLSTVHPRKQRHLIGVHSLAKSFILYPFIFRMCSVERKCTTIIGCCFRSHHQRAGLPIVIPWVASWASLSLNQQCVEDALQKQVNRISYPHTIHKIVCVDV